MTFILIFFKAIAQNPTFPCEKWGSWYTIDVLRKEMHPTQEMLHIMPTSSLYENQGNVKERKKAAHKGTGARRRQLIRNSQNIRLTKPSTTPKITVWKET